ncbi:MAG TPA: NADH-quinone oxidoreductase subunit C, partial [Candidatus Limnocylindria bacterium]|nr:NADH-quinone oxidoreductase subunit C [Candidatus Limnocylindria bacterium]
MAMTTMHALMQALAGQPEPDRPADIRVVRGREVHCAIRPAAVAALARLLRMGFGAELLFMAAADRRPDGAAFEVHYLFGPGREDWFLHASAAVPADDPALTSLATFHYPASRFEREIYDLF